MNLADLRRQIPELEGLDDASAVDAIQQAYYPDLDRRQIADRLGVKLAAPAAPPPAKRSLWAVANDTVIEGANAAAGAVGSAADFISPGNRVSKFIDENIIQPGEASQSDVVRQSRKQFQDEVADADGIGGELMAVGRKVLRDPLLTAAQAAGSFVIPGAAVKGGNAAAAALGAGARGVARGGLAGGAVAGAALSGGDAAGTAYDLVIKAGGSEEEAAAAARQASALPAAVGAAGGLVGAERLLAGAGGMKGGLMARALKTAGVEGVQEGFEEGITQYEGQRAAMPFDPSIDPMKGTAAAAGMGAVMGGAIGGGTSLLSPSHPEVATRRLASADNVADMIGAAEDLAMAPLTPEPKPRAAGADAIAEIRQLDPEQQAEAIGLLGTSNNMQAPGHVRRFAQNRLDELLLPYRQVPVGEATEMLPVGEVTELAPAGENEKRAADTLKRWMVNADPVDEARANEMVAKAAEMGKDFAVVPHTRGGFTVVPQAWLTPGMAERLMAEQRASQWEGGKIPTGEAADLIPTGDVTEAPAKIPTGKATELAVEQIQADDLLTGDDKPYGTRAGAAVRATREGLPTTAVVEVPGGYVVRKENQSEPVADVPVAAALSDGPADGRGDHSPGGQRDAGPVPAGDGGRGGSPAAPAGSGSPAVAVGAGSQPDAALSDDLPTLKKQWAEAVRANDNALAKRINDRIIEIKKNPEQRTASPAAGSQAPAVADSGDGGVATTQAGGAPELPELPALKDRVDAKRQPAQQAAPRQGKIGDKMAGGDVVLTASGRQTTPFPKVAVDTTRKATATIKAVDQWLMANALAEAEARGDNFNAAQFRANQAKPQQADKDSAEEYLFGEQPAVVPSILRPLSGNAAAPAEKAPPEGRVPAAAAPEAPSITTAIEGAKRRLRETRNQIDKLEADSTASSRGPRLSELKGKENAIEREIHELRKRVFDDEPTQGTAAPPAPKPDKAEIRPYRRADGSIGYEAVPIVEGRKPEPAADDGWVEGNDTPNPRFKTWTKVLDDGRELQVLQTGPRTFNATNAQGRPGSGAFGTLAEAKAAAKPSVRTDSEPAAEVPRETPAEPAKPEAAPKPPVGPYAQWRDSTPAQRRELLRGAGYTDSDQARALSGVEWNQLTDPVRRALSAAAAGPASEAEAPKPKRPPKSFRKKVKVQTPVFVEESSSFESREIDADAALAALDADIKEMDAFMACLKG